ncbi:hypothetical protein [Fibrobacter sp.]|uniref:hypothetical protein n=1 Tax=Fibrobacter sp. TaxID=35828 RepID=UPI00388ED446
MDILSQIQHYVADRLNSDATLSGKVAFIPENSKDLDFEIKKALGKQGVVGLVLTPKATFAGWNEDKGPAWQIDELEIDVVENVTVNRGTPNQDFLTGQEAAMRTFGVLCPTAGEDEGKFLPVSYEEGEDNSLLVNKVIFKTLVYDQD